MGKRPTGRDSPSSHTVSEEEAHTAIHAHPHAASKGLHSQGFDYPQDGGKLAGADVEHSAGSKEIVDANASKAGLAKTSLVGHVDGVELDLESNERSERFNQSKDAISSPDRVSAKDEFFSDSRSPSRPSNWADGKRNHGSAGASSSHHFRSTSTVQRNASSTISPQPASSRFDTGNSHATDKKIDMGVTPAKPSTLSEDDLRAHLDAICRELSLGSI